MSGYLTTTPLRSPMPSVFPELCVEWMPTQGPGASDGPWADITGYTVGGGVVAGRRYETDRFDSGTLRLTLESFDRLFDPDWVAGPFYPWLVPMRQIRFTAITPQGVFEPVFRGFVTDWGQTQVQDKKYVTTLTCRDGFVRLEQIKLPSSAWALEVAKDDPTAWFRLGETNTVRVTDSSDGGNYGLYDNCQQGAPSLVVNDSDPAVGFAHSLEERVTIQNPNLISGYPFTVSMMARISGDDPNGVKYLMIGTNSLTAADPSFVIMMEQAAVAVPGTVRTFVWNSSARGVRSSIQIDDGRPHLITVVYAAGSNTAILYVDGVDVSVPFNTGTPTWPGPFPSGYTIGNTSDLIFGDFGFGVNDTAAATAANPFPLKERGTLDEVAVWNGVAVDPARITAHALAALTGWSGDDTGVRVNRFLNIIGWPDILRNVSNGISILGPASWSAGTTALAAMQAWADTELGAFFIGKDGEIVWRSRHYPLLNSNATTSQATFGDWHSGVTLGYQDIDLTRDEVLLRNPVSASRAGGVSVTVKDEELVEKYGDRTYAMTATQDRDDATVRDRAMWGLARWKELGSRLVSMTITPTSEPLLWPQVLGRGLGDRITVERTPLGQGAQIATDQIIERIEHTFTRNTWVTKFSGSPVDPNVGRYLILDDATYGLLDSGLLAY